MSVPAAGGDAEVDRLELDLMESDDDDAVLDRQLPVDSYQHRMASTFPHAGDEEERTRANLYYQWQREKY